MSEFGGGKTKVRRPATAGPVTAVDRPEFTSPAGIITVTRFLKGEPGQDGADGDATPPEDMTLAYDGDGRLSTVTKASGVTSLTYDGDGKLVTVTTPLITKTLAYDGDDRLISVDVT